MAAYGSVIEALSDPTRRAVLERLRTGPRSVGEIARGMPVSRPAVSQHLRVLKSARLVTDHQAGSRRIYEIAPDGLAELRRYLDAFWEAALDGFRQTAEDGPRRNR